MTLLFITQKLHGQDAFGALWVRAFMRRGYTVKVLCLEGSNQDFEFEVRSMGKEKGNSKLMQVINFERAIMTMGYDRVFIHMAPVWYLLGFWWWILKGVQSYLWYTHYKMQAGVKLFGWFGNRFFCATEQSLPQYIGSPRKIVVGHGIDLDFWMKRQNQCKDPKRLLMVHRLSRSKRVEISLHALTRLPKEYTLDIYGIESEKSYVNDMRKLVDELDLLHRVTFHGSAPMERLPEIYVRHHLILNMASETIDKTMLEAMTCGCYPVTTKDNAIAIGVPFAPQDDSPETLADFILSNTNSDPISADEMFSIVKERHGLDRLVEQMDEFIKEGR